MTAGEGAFSPTGQPVAPGDAPSRLAGAERGRWWPRDVALLTVGMILAGALRLALLPTQGSPDLDQFVGWAHAFALGHPLGEAYRLDLSFPPVLTYLIWALGNLVPAFETAIDGSDVGARIALKLPASVADIFLALGVAYLLRDQPRRAIAAALLVAFIPVTWYVSAWWGQFESIYVLLGLVAVILVLADRPMLAAIALGLALMTKPQALVFLVPFAAYALGRYGWRRGAAIGAVTTATVVIAWLPFLADGGPGRYADNLAYYQDGMFAVLSLRAWNVWWAIQEVLAGGFFLADNTQWFGPITPRLLGYAMTGLAMLATFLLVLRRPTRTGLLLGLTASVLVAFSLLTSMHERYSYGGVVFLLPIALAATGCQRAAWCALATATTLNLLVATPPSGLSGTLVPLGGTVGIAGSIVMLGIAVSVIGWLRRAAPPDRR